MLGKKKGRKHGFGVLKIDMSKTYDRVNWVFLKTVLLSMKFTPCWVNWILECVSTFHYTLLVNGSITQSFKPAKGLRQRDSLSPYLFLMCANILSLALIKAKNKGKFRGWGWVEMGFLLLICCLLMIHCYFSKETTNL